MKPLFLTSFFFLIPVYSYILNQKYSLLETIIIISLICNFILSCFFWYDTQKNTLIHKIDAFMARITFIFIFINLIFFKEFNYLTYSLIVELLALIYSSHITSTLKWYSEDHIFYHGLFHFLGALTCTFILL
jgi:hypothetical protein